MALTATIFKAALQIADMERNYYRDHAVTIARHPSETDERMMVRLLAFGRGAVGSSILEAFRITWIPSSALLGGPGMTAQMPATHRPGVV